MLIKLKTIWGHFKSMYKIKMFLRQNDKGTRTFKTT